MASSAFQFPTEGQVNYNGVAISAGSRESIGVPLAAQFQVPTSTAWPLANLALFVPFEIYRWWTLQNFLAVNGATVSGNVDVGVYDDDGERLVSMGSTAQSGTSAEQLFNLADYPLSPTTPNCYLAMSMDNTTGTVQAWTPTAPFAACLGVLEMTSAFPLPPTATFALSTRAFIPELTLLARSFA